MIYTGIDVPKDKYNSMIVDSNGVVFSQTFTIQNNMHGFDQLFAKRFKHLLGCLFVMQLSRFKFV
jgi:hypothetical protein